MAVFYPQRFLFIAESGQAGVLRPLSPAPAVPEHCLPVEVELFRLGMDG